MIVPTPVVWVLVHDLGRSGVPVMLARLLRATPTARATVHVIALRGGVLEQEVAAAAASLTVLEPLQRRSANEAVGLGLATAGAARTARELQRRVWRHRTRRLPRPDVAVVHGAGAWPLICAAPDAVPYVLHLHELRIGLDRCIPVGEQVAAIRGARRLLVVSGPVADLATERGAEPARIDLVPGLVEPSTMEVASQRTGRPVMGAGSVGWRKGTDRLAALAHELARDGRADHVGWIGGSPIGVDAAFVGAPDPVAWFPAESDPWHRMAHAQVIVVPSREDPMPLVALEAGLHRRAVVAMATGGLGELLAGGRGVAVPDQDLVAFVRAVRSLLDDPDQASMMGEELHRRVTSRHTPAVVAPAWWSAICSSV